MPRIWAERLGGIAAADRLGPPRRTRSASPELPGYRRRRLVGAGRRGRACRRGSSATSPASSVADLCAAPGGKTAELAAAGAQVTAVDISASRLKRLAENLRRLGLEARARRGRRARMGAGRTFDAVLLDAPCSATGTIRRHPDIPWLKQRGGHRHARRAAGENARPRRRAGEARRRCSSICTCSLEPEEGEAQVAPFLARHPGVRACADRAARNRRSRASF